MEISAVCANHLVCKSNPPLFPSFSDQSHLEFYQRRTSSLPSLSLLRQAPLRSLSSLGHRRAVCQEICPPPLPDAASDASALMKEFSELRQLMKQKKKELKLQSNKEEKKRMKMQLKMEKKAMKQKDGMERKKKCDLESSSSSESSGEDACINSMSMKMLREQRPLACASLADAGTSEVAGNAMLSRDKICVHDFAEKVTETKRPAHAFFESQLPSTFSEGCCDGNAKAPSVEASLQRETLAPRNRVKFPISQAPNRIEVCAGGKCRKVGSEQLLAALNMQIPGSSDVVAVPCKCMGKCSMTMNVKVVKEDTNPQHHSHVRVEDANFILNHNYGLGRPPSGLPALEPHDWKRVSVSGTV